VPVSVRTTTCWAPAAISGPALAREAPPIIMRITAIRSLVLFCFTASPSRFQRLRHFLTEPQFKSRLSYVERHTSPDVHGHPPEPMRINRVGGDDYLRS